MEMLFPRARYPPDTGTDNICVVFKYLSKNSDLKKAKKWLKGRAGWGVGGSRSCWLPSPGQCCYGPRDSVKGTEVCQSLEYTLNAGCQGANEGFGVALHRI